jgi:hypothetical protein
MRNHSSRLRVLQALGMQKKFTRKRLSNNLTFKIFSKKDKFYIWKPVITAQSPRSRQKNTNMVIATWFSIIKRIQHDIESVVRLLSIDSNRDSVPPSCLSHVPNHSIHKVENAKEETRNVFGSIWAWWFIFLNGEDIMKTGDFPFIKEKIIKEKLLTNYIN